MNTTLTNKQDVEPAYEPPAAPALADPRIRFEMTDDRIGVLTFDRPDSAANIFDRATLEELGGHLTAIEDNPTLRGLIVASAKKSIFIAGADLNSLADTDDAGKLSSLIKLGQETFNRLAALPIPTVAAIHGACVGGGYEICLACDMRVATDDKATKIGLPETQLGILPAWGGSTRLPRLIGLPNALDIIIAGKTVAARKAHKIGMIDGVVPRERLVATAHGWILVGKCPPLGHHRPSNGKKTLFNNSLAGGLIERRVRPDLKRKTRGHYPATTKALEVVVNGLKTTAERSLELEHNAIMELAQTQAAKNLVQVFFLQERAKKLGVVKGLEVPQVRDAAVLGAGVMGSGIAQWLSSRGCNVTMRDINADAVARGMANIDKLYQAGVKRRKFTAVEARQGMDRVRPTMNPVSMKHTDLIVEAAVEKLDLKVDLFHQLESLSRDDTILATNTSALSISTIAQELNHPERVVGIHFFNPVHRMQLVEVIRGEKTDPEVLHRSVKFVQQIGKMPVVVKDSPGFVVNRILMPCLIEAAMLFEQGADIHDIDEAMLDFGMPMGPLRLVDEVGVDVARHVCDTLAQPFSKYLAIPKVLDSLMERRWLGRKTGKGFYVHDGKKCLPNEADIRFLRDDHARSFPLGQLQSRMVLLMVNEAARCLEEEIVAGPEDIDFAMIMGAGFAPFRGGPLRFADHFGGDRIVADMNQLVEAGEKHFLPCDLLADMARAGKRFYQH